MAYPFICENKEEKTMTCYLDFTLPEEHMGNNEEIKDHQGFQGTSGMPAR